VAIVLFLLAARRRPAWQWLALGGGLGSAVALMLYMPYSYSGGGGPVGNRYFLGVYPVFLFVTPPLMTTVGALVAVAGGAIFTAQLITNPFIASFRPSEHVKSGPYRVLPVEMTLLSDLPMNVTPTRVKVPLGGVPPVLAYFLDDNAYGRERSVPDGPLDAFWVRGRSRAELLLRSPIVMEGATGAEVVRQLRIPRMEVHLESGAEPNRVTIETAAGTQIVEIPPRARRAVIVDVGAGLPYHPDPQLPMNYVYRMAIESETGFIPMFWSGGGDARYLGVFVRLVPLYE
jgi:hypothetical protein